MLGRDSQPRAITNGSDGNRWFTEGTEFTSAPAKIARITPAGAITEFWTPTADDVQRAEPRITEYLQANAPALVPKFSSYVRQYTGFRLGGRTLIFVQFFCVAPTNVDWRCAPVVVDDGGECYFRLVYDVGGDSCGNLYVNGDA